MQEFTTSEEWQSTLSTSNDTPFFIFKHSTSCPTSAMAHNRVEAYLAQRSEDTPPFVLVKVIESRPLSNAIAQQLEVTHQSPQLIFVKNGNAVWDASHHMINEESISDAIEALG